VKGKVLNLPNALTGLRLALCPVLFWTLTKPGAAWADLGLFLLLLGGLTDLLDGWLARRWKEETVFGRLVDPLADKVMICGTFLFLLVRKEMALPLPDGPGLGPWMIVAILAREFLVSGMRSFAESSGWSFPATWPGKSKMATQFACLCVALLFLSGRFHAVAWAPWTMAWMLWITVAVTVGSCGTYVARFVSLARREG